MPIRHDHGTHSGLAVPDQLAVEAFVIAYVTETGGLAIFFQKDPKANRNVHLFREHFPHHSCREDSVCDASSDPQQFRNKFCQIVRR